MSDALAESIAVRIHGHITGSTAAITDKLSELTEDIKATADESKRTVDKVHDLIGHAGRLAQIMLELQQQNDHLRAFAARMAIQACNSRAYTHNRAVVDAYLRACKAADHARVAKMLDTPLMLVHPGPTAQVLSRLGQTHIEGHHDATHDEAVVPAKFFAVCPHSIQAALDLSLAEINAFGRHVRVHYFSGAAAPTSFVKDAVEQNRMAACKEILKFLSGR
ncbi:hypothetical protein GGF32_001978 [Allomyces javanicus]|nr:hypothetical protein GGF32_001978 [Allomyces javanicus]